MNRRELIVGGLCGCTLTTGCLGFGSAPVSLSIFNRTDRTQHLTVTVTNARSGESVRSQQFEMGPDSAQHLRLDRRRGVAYDATVDVEGGERAAIGLSPSTSSVDIEIEAGGEITYRATVS